ncbi:hypothetical protein PFJ87_11g00340 [Encephalitozoon hellem]|uniref:Uncharacterized protein n=1 Tax=Encephalitozoon hellem TaxID=27973 RepID=A0ABY8CLL6_ENCHE|nr:hypothetical protein PFJ87_11g00340 [Encephalitozoon hellem]
MNAKNFTGYRNYAVYGLVSNPSLDVYYKTQDICFVNIGLEHADKS